MVAIFAERGMKAARKKGGNNPNGVGGKSGKRLMNDESSVIKDAPTAVDAIAAHTGVAKETVARRVKQAAKITNIKFCRTRDLAIASQEFERQRPNSTATPPVITSPLEN